MVTDLSVTLGNVQSLERWLRVEMALGVEPAWGTHVMSPQKPCKKLDAQHAFVILACLG